MSLGVLVMTNNSTLIHATYEVILHSSSTGKNQSPQESNSGPFGNKPSAVIDRPGKLSPVKY